MNLIIDKTIDEFIEEYLKDNNLVLSRDDFRVDVYHVAESGRFLVVFYRSEAIGSFLQYRDEIIRNIYYKDELGELVE